MSVKEFAKRNIIGIIAIIIGFAVSFYFYEKSQDFPEPVFLLDPSRTIIVDSGRFSDTSLQVVRPNGKEIEGDVTSVRFYFWNNGRKSIKKANILEPLAITLDDPNGEILDYKILKCSRKIVKPTVERNSIDPNTNLSFSFTILEKGDGVTGQIIYEGDPTANLVISGIIEGARRILTITNAVIQRRWYKEFIKDIVIIFLAIGFFGFYFSVIQSKAGVKPTKPKPTKMSSFAPFPLIVLGMMSVILLFFALKKHFKIVPERTPTSFIKEVPKDIIP